MKKWWIFSRLNLQLADIAVIYLSTERILRKKNEKLF